MLDAKKLAVIHIVKKELGISDEYYRATLEKVSGVSSAKDLDQTGFRKLMRYFAASRHYRQSLDGITFRQKMYIRHLLADLSWDAGHYANFLRKYYKTLNQDSLSRKEASRLIESLKHIKAGQAIKTEGKDDKLQG